MACFSVACSDDPTPAPQTGAASNLTIPDASVRDLPGDGLELTPASDIDNRQRVPIGPQGVNDEVSRYLGNLDGSRGRGSSAPDAGVDRGDAGTR